MMSSMLRLLSVSAVLALSLNAASDKDIIKFVKRGLSSNPAIKKVIEVKILEKQPVYKLPDWSAYIIEFKLTVNDRDKDKNITNTDILFAKDRFVAPDLVDVKTNRSIKSRIVRSLSKDFYDKEHLIYGNPDAKHKIVVFSDPLCPFCREVVPKLFEAAKKHPDTFALYYYHLPIKSLHPASVPLAKAIIYLKKKGDKEAIEKIYKTEFNYEERDESKVLAELDKKLGIKLTKEQINKPEIKKELQEDMKKASRLMVRGTPTIFFDGKYDRTREKYLKYIKSEENETNNSNTRK